TQKFDDNDDRDAKEHKRPGKLTAEDAINDCRHKTTLRRCGLFAADTLNPLDLDLAAGWVVEVLTILERAGSDGVEENVFVRVIDLLLRLIIRVARDQSDSVATEVSVVLDAVGEMVEREGDGFGEML